MELMRSVVGQGPCIVHIAEKVAVIVVQSQWIPTDIVLKGRK
jgi:hypothetical protein